MLDLSSLLISHAWADTATGTAAASGNVVMQFLPFFLILGVFYFLLIRPQQKKLDAQDKMLKELKKGDKIITNGGLVATIAKIENDDYMLVDIAEGTRVRLLRSGVSKTLSEEITAAKNDNEKKD